MDHLRAVVSVIVDVSDGRVHVCAAIHIATPRFVTRSPHRPNPLGLHRVTVRRMEPGRLLAGPIEAVDGTPVVDIKSA